MVAQFPKFSNLQLSHQEIVNNFTARFKPYSDFDFTSLFCWNTDESSQIAFLNDNLVIRLPDYISGELIYSLLGSNKIDESLVELARLAPQLHLVPEEVVRCIKQPGSFIVEETPGQFDYIFDLRQMSQLAGGNLRGKRKAIYRYLRNYEDQSVLRDIDFGNPLDQREIRTIFERWAKEGKKSKEDFAQENVAIENLLRHASSFKLMGLLLMIDNQPAGFSVHEGLANKYAICHFQKSLLSFVGIDAFLTQAANQRLVEAGYLYVNWEQDLGLPGLEELKKSYKPLKMLKKYSIKVI